MIAFAVSVVEDGKPGQKNSAIKHTTSKIAMSDSFISDEALDLLIFFLQQAFLSPRLIRLFLDCMGVVRAFEPAMRLMYHAEICGRGVSLLLWVVEARPSLRR